MSIRKTKVVDWLGIEKGSGNVLLTVLDDEDWTNEQEHLELLQDKLNSYLAFIESGEIYQALTAELGRDVSTSTPVIVRILAKYPASSRAMEFLGYAERMFAGAGFRLTHKVLPVAEAPGN